MDYDGNGVLTCEETYDALRLMGLGEGDKARLQSLIAKKLDEDRQITFIAWYGIVEEVNRSSPSEKFASRHNILISKLLDCVLKFEHKKRKENVLQRLQVAIDTAKHRHEAAS